MPRKYIRKTDRESWTEEGLEKARKSIEEGMSVRTAETVFGIPARALSRHIKEGNFMKKPLRLVNITLINIGTVKIENGINIRSFTLIGVLGIQNEKKLAEHVKKLASVDFAVDREGIRSLAFELAEKWVSSINLTHKLKKQDMLGWHPFWKGIRTFR